MKTKLAQNTSDASHILNPSKHNSIYLNPTDSTEISEIIVNLKVKATSDSIKKANESNSICSEIIFRVINASLCEGIFPTVLKTAYTKTAQKLTLQINGQFRLYQRFQKKLKN